MSFKVLSFQPAKDNINFYTVVEITTGIWFWKKVYRETYYGSGTVWANAKTGKITWDYDLAELLLSEYYKFNMSPKK